jgi:predicted PurR-regulated permease PerM
VTGWKVHDLVVGLLAGAAGGFVLGLFATRLIDSIVVPFAAASVGAVAGWGLLRWDRPRRVGRSPFGPITAAAWVVLVLGVGFVALLFDAISDFE